MSLKIRCSSCRRGTSGKHSLCSGCRTSTASETIVFVTGLGDRIEVTTTDRPSKSSRSGQRSESKSGHAPTTDRHGESSTTSHDSAGSYRDASRSGCPYPDPRRGGCDEIPGVRYVRPMAHPYEDKFDYISANTQYVYPHPQNMWQYPGSAQGYHVPPSHAGYGQPPSGGYYPEYSPAPSKQASSEGGKVEYVYSGTEGPDGEVID
jgi:hypothetical protein